ncbi:MAG: M48 family metallopeptidase [Planctomycetaceae bacterium]|nr:M48 family metallopeptidase [Planctomycetaceae bacterium]
MNELPVEISAASRFASYLTAFEECVPLGNRLLAVLAALPHGVQRDFLDDPRFQITLENFVPGSGWKLWVGVPGPIGNGSRCVVLRPKLAHCSEAFAHYVIAHELAHAFLRNGGWGSIVDREEAADTLAASWGFARPR